MKILNLGCGSKTSSNPIIVNIDWSIYLRIKEKSYLRPIVPFILAGKRLERFNAMPDNILVHNLANGLPFADNSISAVYHSHMLEHLDRDVAEGLLIEVKRVLVDGGIHRIVVPDLELVCSKYLEHIAACSANYQEKKNHDLYIEELLEQSVRKEASGTSNQGRIRRYVENLLLGDARRRGETHQWMYDRINLAEKLDTIGYSQTVIQDYNTSLISGWNDIGLDIDESGNQYKPGSLYIEAVK